MATEKYKYDNATQKYTFFAKSKLGKDLVLPLTIVKDLVCFYSDYDGKPLTSGEISKKVGIPKEALDLIYRALNFTHSNFPLLREEKVNQLELDDAVIEECVDELFKIKTLTIKDSFDKKEALELKKDAEAWRAIRDRDFKEIEKFVKTLGIKKKAPAPLKKSQCKEYYVVGLSDIHFGDIHHSHQAFNNAPYKKEDIEKSFGNYVQGIKRDLAGRKTLYDTCYLLDLGDVFHSLTSFTSKGTKLGEGFWGVEQFKLGYTILKNFIEELSKIFNKLVIKTVYGNHDSLHDHLVYYVLESYFENDGNILFEISSNRWLDFQMGQNLIVMEHGNSDKIKNTVLPEHSTKREVYIMSLFESALKNGKYKNIKNKIFFCGDKHNIQFGEYNEFEFFRFSTCVKGNQFADEKVLKNRPRFNGLIVNEDGIKEIINFYV